MSDENQGTENNQNTPQSQPIPNNPEGMTVIGIKSAEKPPVWGIISTILGGASLLPLLGILSPFGVILGVVGIIRDERHTVAIIGTVLSVIGILTSPIVWAVLSPPDKYTSPTVAGIYWGVVTFLIIIIAAVGGHYLKEHLSQQEKPKKD